MGEGLVKEFARVDNWPAKLNEVIEAHRTMPFEWGKHDCVTFTADCVKAMTDHDPLSFYRGGYTTAAGAYEIIEELGGIERAVEHSLAFLNAFKREINLAQRGDVVIADIEGKLIVGIWIGRAALMPSEQIGLTEIPKEMIKTCWGIV